MCLVSKIEPLHSCNDSENTNAAKSLIKHAIEHSDMTKVNPKSLISCLNRDINSIISYDIAFKALKSYKISINLIIHNYYRFLNSLLNKENTNYITNLEIIETRFKRLFYSWEAAKNLFLLSRKIYYG